MKTDELIAIDTHTHAEVSCWNPFDNYGEEYDRAADRYFGSNRRPTIDETVAHVCEILALRAEDPDGPPITRRVPTRYLRRTREGHPGAVHPLLGSRD